MVKKNIIQVAWTPHRHPHLDDPGMDYQNTGCVQTAYYTFLFPLGFTTAFIALISMSLGVLCRDYPRKTPGGTPVSSQ